MCGCNKNKAPVLLERLLAPVPGQPPVAPPIPTVDTSIWGASMWKVLHIAALYNEKLSQWRVILQSLLTDLPCPDCRAHYAEWYNSHPLKSGLIPRRFRRQVIIWLFDLHNAINLRTGRPVWTIAQLDAAYSIDQLQDAKNTLDTLQGIIGQSAWNALHYLLHRL